MQTKLLFLRRARLPFGWRNDLGAARFMPAKSLFALK
jgi:hypothetical protein